MKIKLIILLVLTSLTNWAQVVTNGSINGTAVSPYYIDNAPGWSVCNWTPDFCDINHPSYSSSTHVTPVSSPDGGSWLGLYGNGECASTTITGLTIGTQYTMPFFGACFGTDSDITKIGNKSPATITITVGTIVQTFSIPMVASTWNTYSIIFTATSDTMPLKAENFSDSTYASLDGFRIQCPPSTLFLGNDTTLCAGATLTLDATTSNATYLWQNNSTNPTFTVTQQGIYSVEVTVKNCVYKDTINVSYNPLPLIVLSNDETICSGTSTTLTASGANSYSWSPATGLSGTTGTSVTASPTVNTTYTVTGTNNCGTSNSEVTVTLSFSLTVNVNSATICLGSSTTLTASGANAYSWSPSSGLSGTTGTSVTASPTVTTTYSVSQNSCGTSTALSTVTVLNPPTVSVNSATIICSGPAATLTASGAISCSWSPVTGLSGTTGTSVTASPNATTTYTVTGIDSCGSGTATSTVTVINTLTVTVNSETLCSGTSTTLTASGANSNSYFWSPSTGLSASSGTSVTASPTATTTYTVIGTNSCGATDTANSIVSVFYSPIVNVNSAIICSGTSATLNANGASDYSWSPATGLSSNTGATVVASPTANATFTVTGTNNCGTNTAEATVTTISSPTITVNSVSICSGASATLMASGCNVCQWSGEITSTSSSVTISPINTTNYSVVADNGGCLGTPALARVYIYPTSGAEITSSGIDSTFTFFNPSQQDTNCVTYFGDGDSLLGCNWNSIAHNYPNEGNYKVTQMVVNTKGCKDTMQTDIVVEFQSTLYIPNSFTPNADGINDIFYCYGTEIKNFQLSIYDRWGMLVFESSDINKGWDGTYKGTVVQKDVYVWKIEYLPKKSDTQKRMGFLTVLR